MNGLRTRRTGWSRKRLMDAGWRLPMILPAPLRDTPGWRVLVEERRAASEQMALDVRLAADAIPTLRVFLWPEAALSLGWKQVPPAWLDAPRMRRQGIEVVERPTAGGVAFHGSDVSCAVVLPARIGLSLHAAMAMVCEAVARGCRMWAPDARAVTELPSHGRVAVCLTESSSYGVYVGPRKVAGLALRRFPASWLIQGSLLVGELPEPLRQALPESVQQDLARRAVSVSAAAGRTLSPRDVAQAWALRWADWVDELLLERLIHDL